MKWRRTAFKRLDGSIDVMEDDWSLSDGGLSLARLYRLKGGPQDGRWAWFVQIGPDGAPANSGTGVSLTGAEARKACEDRLPEAVRARLQGIDGQG
ncbi:hypothetical protein LG047_12430 [Methylocystis sp. WRRC1]|uniref:hypothetical protein n=1 Tax=unclassified Methylocystis TaxID=2625913 RepID=UPI0001F87895|nr:MULTISPECIES: hypothetical protein [unclassified Methylocystis]MCC3246116.1 hypothetical protein [Methylocystis sp. WRRC1]